MKRIEIKCGPDSTQLVRAVIPCQGQVDWTIDGVPAQSNVVTRDHDNQADTIELVATLPNKAINGLAIYEAQPATEPTPIDLFQGTSLSYRIEFIDSKLRTYLFNPNQTFTQYGSNQCTKTQIGTLNHVDGTKLLGVKVIITQYKDQAWSEFDVDISNGLLVGDIEFNSLAIIFDDNYVAYPMTGSMRPCSKSEGSKHWLAKPASYFWRKQGQIQRRFIVAKPLSISRKYLEYLRAFGTLGFCLDWTEAFGPTKTGIGLVTGSMKIWGTDNKQYIGREAQRRLAAQKMSALKSCLEKGIKNENHGVYSVSYGPFHPYHIPMQGAQGGFGILHYSGESLCLEDYVANVCIAHMCAERQNIVMTLPNGNIKTVKDFVEEGNGTIQFDFAPYDFEINGVPTYNNLPPFTIGDANKELKNWPPFDAQHQCRYNKPLQALVFLGNDSIAKHQMEVSAEINLLYLNIEEQNAGWGGTHNLKGLLKYATLNPRQGGVLGRAQCWPVDAIMAFHALATPEWRTKNVAWINAMASLIIISQMPTGWNNRVDPDAHSQVSETAKLPMQYDVAQTFEVEFEDWIKRCLAVAISPRDRLRRGLNKSMIRSAQSFFKTNVYDGNAYKWYIAVGHNNGDAFMPTELAYNLTSGNAETFYGWYVLNHAYLAAKEINDTSVDWLSIALSYRQTANSYQNKLEQLSKLASEDWNNHLPQAVGLMASLEAGNTPQ